MHRLSLITNTMANGSAVEAVASQPCDLQLTLPTGLFCLHAAHGWLHPLSVIERVEGGGGGGGVVVELGGGGLINGKSLALFSGQ